METFIIAIIIFALLYLSMKAKPKGDKKDGKGGGKGKKGDK
jgi:hypothetical protein